VYILSIGKLSQDHWKQHFVWYPVDVLAMTARKKKAAQKSGQQQKLKHTKNEFSMFFVVKKWMYTLLLQVLCTHCCCKYYVYVYVNIYIYIHISTVKLIPFSKMMRNLIAGNKKERSPFQQILRGSEAPFKQQAMQVGIEENKNTASAGKCAEA